MGVKLAACAAFAALGIVSFSSAGAASRTPELDLAAATVARAASPHRDIPPRVRGNAPVLRWHFEITSEGHGVAGQSTWDRSRSFTLDGEASLVPLATGQTTYTQAFGASSSLQMWAGSGACGQGAGGGVCDMFDRLISTAPGTLQVDSVTRDPSGNPTEVKTHFATLPVETFQVTCTGDCGVFDNPSQQTEAVELLDEAYPGELTATRWTHPQGTAEWISTRRVTTTHHGSGTTNRVRARWSLPAGPEAEPGTYSVPRAGTVTLDAGASTDASGTITDYDWDFAPGRRCPAGTTLTHTHQTGKTVPVTALCDLNVTLTVIDDQGLTDTATTNITVTRRTGAFTTTPVTHQLSGSPDPRRPTGWPTTAGVIAGRNVSACTQTADHRAMLCPHVAIGRSHLGKGFTIDTVANPGGPFDGFAYVSGTTLRLRREALLNPTLGRNGTPPPGAQVNWFLVNTAHGTDIHGLMTSVQQHEGMGAPGRLRSGHSGLFLLATRTKPGNVNARLEPLFDPDPTHLQTRADTVVDTAQRRLFESGHETNRQPIGWSGDVRVWDPNAGTWVRDTSWIN